MADAFAYDSMRQKLCCRGMSGGQAKRTNVALAMVVNPRVLFLDEPRPASTPTPPTKP